MSKSRTAKTTLPAAFARHCEKLGIDSNLRARLESSASRIFDLGRRTTEQTFELGDHLDEAAALLDEGHAWQDFTPSLTPSCSLH